MKCQILFARKNKKISPFCCLLKLPRVVKIKMLVSSVTVIQDCIASDKQGI